MCFSLHFLSSHRDLVSMLAVRSRVLLPCISFEPLYKRSKTSRTGKLRRMPFVKSSAHAIEKVNIHHPCQRNVVEQARMPTTVLLATSVRVVSNLKYLVYVVQVRVFNLPISLTRTVV